MKTFFSDIIPKIQKYSEKLDNITLLTNQHWVVIDDVNQVKIVYIFRQNNELLISQNGKVEKAKWEYLGHNSLLVDKKEESYLFKHGFFDENILALKIDSKDEYAFLVNESKFDKELNSLENIFMFLNEKYIDPNSKQNIQNTTGFKINDSIPSIDTNSYIAPSHKITKLSEHNSLLVGKTQKYLIEFDDNLSGMIYLEVKQNEAFFKGKPEGFWVNVTCLYVDWNNCVNALHYFLKTKKLLSIGLRGSY